MPVLQFFLIGSALLFSLVTNAGSINPITYQGRILKPDGTALEANTTFRFVIKSPDNCALWQEDITIDMAGSKGALTAVIGAGTNTAGGIHSFSDVFNNAKTITGVPGCSSGTDYIPGLTDDRTLQVSFNDGTTAQVIPAIAIKSVPFSKYAYVAQEVMSLFGRTLGTTPPTVSGQIMRYNAASQEWEVGPAPGGVSSVDLNLGGGLFTVTSSPITGAGTLTATLSNQNANQVFAGPTSGGPGTPTFRSLDANDIPALDAGKIVTGTLATSVLGVVPGANGGTVVQVNTGAGLEGGPINTHGTISLGTSGVAAGSYGSASWLPNFVVDIYGRLTSAGSVAVAIDATQVVGGTLAVARIPDLDAAKITSGTFDTARLGTLPFSSISGILSNANGGTGLDTSTASAGQLLIGNGSGFSLGTLHAGSNITINNQNGTVTISSSNSGGTLTQIDSGTGLTGGPINLHGTLSLADTSVTPGAYGSGTHVSQFTVDQQGRLTAAGSVAVAIDASQVVGGTLATSVLGVVPGANGGTVVQVDTGAGLVGGPFNVAGTISLGTSGVSSGSYGSASQIPTYTVDQYGRLTAAATVAVSIDASQVSSGTLDANLIPDLDAAKLVSGTLATARLGVSGVTAGSYGSGDFVPTFSVDQYGRLTSAGSTAITSSQWSNVALGINYGSGGSVGIGVATPVVKLDVAGAIKIANDSAVCSAGFAGAIRYSGGLLQYCDGATPGWITLGVSGSGLQSFNGLVANDQFFAVGSSGTVAAFTSSGSLHTLNIPMASTTDAVGGLLSNSEYLQLMNGTIPAARLADTSVTPGSYGSGTHISQFTVDQQGRLTAAGSVAVAIDASQIVGGTLATSVLGVVPGANGGTVVQVDTGAGLEGGPFNTAGTISLGTTGVDAGSYGSSSWLPNFVVDIYGRLTSAGSTQIAIDASQVTSGTLNSAQLGMVPTNRGGTGLDGSTASDGQLLIGNGSGYSLGTLTAGTNITITNSAGGITIASSNSGGTVTQVVAGTGLTGGTISTTGTIALSDTAVDPGTYGSADHVSWVTVNGQGRITLAGTTQIAINANQITSGTLDTARLGVSGVTAGSYGSGDFVPTFNVDQYGRLTSAGSTAITSSQWSNIALGINYGSGGSVGIGVATPVVKLDVAGAIKIANDSAVCGPSFAGAIRYSGGLLQYCDGSTPGWVSLGVSGSGLQSFNGLIANDQFFAVGSSGTLAAFTSSGSLHTLNIPMASTTDAVGGLLSHAEYLTLMNGTIPAARLADTSVAPGSYGSGTHISQFTVDQQGRLTAAGSTAVAIDASQIVSGTLATSVLGVVPGANGGTVVQVDTGAGLVGGPINNHGTISLGTSGVASGSYGSNSWLPNFVVDIYGRLTSAGSTQIAIDASQVTSGTLASSLIPDLDASKITSGTLNSAQLGMVPTNRGGTGLDGSTASDGQLLIGNGSGYSLGTLTAGSNITITNSAGGITIASSNSGGTVTHVDTGAGLEGGPINNHGTISLGTSGVAAGSYGSASQIPTYTVDQYGRLTSTGTVAVNIDASQVTSGTLDANLIPDLDAAKLVSGTLATARLGVSGVTAGSYGSGTHVPTFNVDQYGRLTSAGSTAITSSQWSNVALGINYASGGSVGIGVATPVVKLDVAGAIKIANDSAVCGPSFAGAIRYSGGLLQYCDGSTPGWVSLGVSGSGLQSLNGLIANNQDFAVGSSGTVAAFTSSGSLHTLNIPMASTTDAVGGLLSHAEYLTLMNGTIPAARVADLDASQITSGTLALARLGTLGVAQGATGLTPSAGDANKVYGVDNSGNTAEFKEVTGGTGITVNHSAGTITISTNGMGSVTEVIAGAGLTGGTITSAGTIALPTLITAGTVGSATYIPQIGFDAFGRIVSAGSFAVSLSSLDGTLGVSQGGTGLDGSTAANGALLIGNGSGFTLGTLTYSNGMVVTNSAGTINLATNAQTANVNNTIITRDGSGNFVAGAADLAGVSLRGSVTGTATLTAPSSFTNYAMTLPTDMGTPGQVLSSNGTSQLSWVSAPVNGGTILAASGSAGTPGISFLADQDTGLSNPGDGTLVISNNGVTALRFVSGQRALFTGDVSTEGGNLYTNNLITTGGRIMQQNANSLNYIAGSLAVGTSSNPVVALDVAGAIRIANDAATCAAGFAGAIRYNAGTLEYCNGVGPAWLALGVSGSGLQSLNGLTANNQFFAVDSSGTLAAFTSAGSLHTLNIPMGSTAGAVAGLISNADYLTLMNGTIPSSRISLGTTGVGSGTIGSSTHIPVLSYDQYGRLTSVGSSAISFSGGTFLAASGSAGTPGFAFSADPDTGLWSPGANTLAFSVGGVEKFRIDSLGPKTPTNTSITVGNWGSGSGQFVNLEFNGGPQFVGNWGASNIWGIGAATMGADPTVRIGTTTGPGNAWSNSTAANLVIDGKMAIGTTVVSSTAMLDVKGAAQAQSQVLVGLGTITLNPPTSGSYSLQFPATVGSPGQVLSTDGTGALSWIAPSAGVTFPLLSTTRGSVSTPAYSFSGDSDTGLWSPGANTLAISTGGTARVTIANNGNVGIGTTSPSSLFSVAGDQSANANFFYDNPDVGDNNNGQTLAVHRRAAEGDDSLSMFIDATRNARITSSNYLTIESAYGVRLVHGWAGTYQASNTGNYTPGISGFETSGPWGPTNSGTSMSLHTTNTGGTSQRGYIGAFSSGSGFTPTIFIGQQTSATAYEERLRIDPTGNIGIGTTSVGSGNRLEVTGGAIAAGNQGELRMMESITNGTNSVGFRAPTALAQNYLMTLPGTIGTPGQVLATDGTGNLSWTSVAAGSSASGNNGELQFNNSGTLAGSPTLTWDRANHRLHVAADGSGEATINLSYNNSLIAGGDQANDDHAGTLGVMAPSARNGSSSNKNGGVLQLSGGRSTGTGSSRIDFLTATAGSSGAAIRDPSTKMTILGNGNVGIGTTYPFTRLDVIDQSFATNSGFATSSLMSNSPQAADRGGALGFGGSDGVTDRFFGVIAGRKENSTSGNYSGYLEFASRSNGSQPVERMRITSTGSVGIGTSIPSQLLDVAGGFALSGAGTAALLPPTGGNYSLRLPSAAGANGQVLGLNGAGTLGWVSAPVNGGVFLAADGAVGSPGISFSADPDTGMYRIGNNSIGFSTNGANRVILNNTGLGIGTAPNVPLHVSAATGEVLRLENTALVAPAVIRLAAYDSGSNYRESFISMNPATGTNNSYFAIGNNSGDPFTFKMNGQMGVGTASVSAGAGLEVNTGAIKAANGNQFRFGETLSNGTNWISLQSPDALAANYSMYLPDVLGGNGQVLAHVSNGSLGWVSAPTNGGTFLAASGSAGTPGFAFSADPDTGLWNPGANTLAFSTGGSQRVTITDSGNVGIGVSNPGHKLEVAQSSPGNAIYSRVTATSGTNYAVNAVSSGSGATQNIGAHIGATGATQNIALNIPSSFPPAGAGNFALYVQSTAHNYLAGSLGIGTTTPGARLDVAGDIQYTGTITDVSDQRLKENIQALGSGLEVVRNLPVYSYSMIDDPSHKTEFGVMAQDVKKIVPQLVRIVNPEKGYMGVNYIGLIPWSLRAIQEIDSDITELKTENQDLKNRLDKLEAQNQLLTEQVQMLIELHKKSGQPRRSPSGQ